MSVAGHRIAACAILICGSLTLVAVGRTMVQDSVKVTRVRSRLDGKWVATRVQPSPFSSATGAAAAATTVEFHGRSVRFRNLIEGGDAVGTYVIDPLAHPDEVDFKVDAGWIRGRYHLQGDRLIVCVNALRPIEQLGVPTRGYPDHLRQTIGRYRYEFEYASP